MEKRVVTFIVRNQPGVLYRVSGLLSRRGYNIDSITVGATMDPAFSRMTVMVEADDRVLEQVVKQIRKLIDVKRVRMMQPGEVTLSEIVLLKVRMTDDNRKAVVDMANALHVRITDLGRDTATLQAVGSSEDIDSVLALFEPLGMLEMARTGAVALERGDGFLEQYQTNFEEE